VTSNNVQTHMCGEEIKVLLQKSFRTKSPDSVTSDTNLHRCLGVVDLVVIGVGAMIGSGIYVMTGIAAKEQAGRLNWVIIGLDVLN